MMIKYLNIKITSRIIFLFLALAASIPVFTQDAAIGPSIIITGEFLGETPPLRDLPTLTEEDRAIMAEKGRLKMLNPTLKHRAYPYAETALPQGPDPAWQRVMGNSRETRAPLQNWEGASVTGIAPTDPNGTVGPNHYMQTINTFYTIYNRAGAIVAGPTALNMLFFGVAGSAYNNGDPIVLYDEQADRWLVAEFSLDGTTDYMMIAVSTTNDPTGTWYKYSFDVWDVPDYPKFGVWHDGYYMGTNTYNNPDIYVFERSKMLAGLTPQGVGFDNPLRPGPSNLFNCVPPLDNDGDFAPAGEPGLFIAFNDDAVGGGNDELWIYELDVDWVTPANSTFARTQQIGVASFDSNFGTTMANIVQQGTAQKVDAIPQVIMNPPQYRNFGSYETIVCCHNVDVDQTDHAGIRWYELRRRAGGDWTVRQQGTYAPDAHSRWMGSIVLNGSNEIALGYSVSSSTLYPGIRYCGQSAAAYSDSTGILDVTEQTIHTGATSQLYTYRWGDYSALQVDIADDETFWFTSQYVTGTSNPQTLKTKIANFQIGTEILTANFAVNNSNPQTYSAVTFTDVSFGSPTSWAWTIYPPTYNFVEGTIATSQNPKVQFTAPGYYTISLTSTAGGNSDSETKTNFINVTDCGYLMLPFKVNFADSTLPACWKNVDNVGIGQVWRFDNPAGRIINTTSDTNGFAILDSDFFGAGYTQMADLITPTLDLSAYSTVNVYFEHYYYHYTGSWARFYYSINNGASWSQLGYWNTSTTNPAYFNQAVSQVAGQSNVRFKWTYYGSYAWYWAIDDISITGTGPNTWTGTTSTDWATASNWSAGTVPTSTSNVIIPAVAPNWPTFPGNFSMGTPCDKLTLYGSSQLNINGNFILTSGETVVFNGDGVINMTGDLINSGGVITPGNGTFKFSGSSPSRLIPTLTSTTSILNYYLSTFPKGMTELTAPVNAGPTGDDKGTTVASFGFTFNYLGTSYSKVRICTNGWILLLNGNSTENSSLNTKLFTTSAPNVTLAPWWDDLTDDATSVISYKTEGTAPYRALTVEWKSMPTYRTGATERISFQVRLYETTNIIEFHYGNLVPGTNNAAESASIGIEDATGGANHFIEATTGSSTSVIDTLQTTTEWPTVNYRFIPPPGTGTFKNITVDKSNSYLDLLANNQVNGNVTITSGGLYGPANINGNLAVKGNWINNGTYTPGSGAVVFNGPANQNIGGTSSSAFNKLTINNPAGITLLNDQTSSHLLTMTSGNVNCGAYTLQLGTSASSPGTLSWTAGNIQGNFKRWIAASTAAPIDFPVGTAFNNHRARITFSNNTEGSLTAKFESGDPWNNSGFPLTDGTETINSTDLYAEGSWTLVPTSLSSTSYALELSGTGFSSAGTFNDSVRILKRPDAGGDWTLDGTHVAGSPPVAKRTGLSGFSRFVLAKPAQFKGIYGNITYYNQVNSPLTSGVTVKLFRDGSQVGTDYIVTDGSYQFNNLTPGMYELRVSSSNPTEGSINTTDAAQTNYWGAAPYQIEKVRFYAGDVTGGSFYINSTDALLIQDHFVNGTAFNKGAWAFWRAGETISSNSSPAESYPQVTLGTSTVTANLYGLCAGDFNGSYIPGAKRTGSESLKLIHDETIRIVAGQEFDLPVRMLNPGIIGAASLILHIPQASVEVTDVRMMDQRGHLNWAVRGDELRIGWITLNPVHLQENEELLTLKLKTGSDFMVGSPLSITLAPDPLNELADGTYQVIPHATLGIALAEAGAIGLQENDTGKPTGLSCYPNPFNSSTLITYTLPENGCVVLEIHDILGIRIASLINEVQPGGTHSVEFFTSHLPKGLYIASLNFNSGNRQKTSTLKLMKNK
jgi:hypothetical protein